MIVIGPEVAVGKNYQGKGKILNFGTKVSEDAAIQFADRTGRFSPATGGRWEGEAHFYVDPSVVNGKLMNRMGKGMEALKQQVRLKLKSGYEDTFFIREVRNKRGEVVDYEFRTPEQLRERFGSLEFAGERGWKESNMLELLIEFENSMHTGKKMHISKLFLLDRKYETMERNSSDNKSLSTQFLEESLLYSGIQDANRLLFELSAEQKSTEVTVTREVKDKKGEVIDKVEETMTLEEYLGSREAQNRRERTDMQDMELADTAQTGFDYVQRQIISVSKRAVRELTAMKEQIEASNMDATTKAKLTEILERAIETANEAREFATSEDYNNALIEGTGPNARIVTPQHGGKMLFAGSKNMNGRQIATVAKKFGVDIMATRVTSEAAAAQSTTPQVRVSAEQARTMTPGKAKGQHFESAVESGTPIYVTQSRVPGQEGQLVGFVSEEDLQSYLEAPEALFAEGNFDFYDQRNIPVLDLIHLDQAPQLQQQLDQNQMGGLTTLVFRGDVTGGFTLQMDSITEARARGIHERIPSFNDAVEAQRWFDSNGIDGAQRQNVVAHADDIEKSFCH